MSCFSNRTPAALNQNISQQPVQEICIASTPPNSRSPLRCTASDEGPTGDANHGINSALRVTLLHCILQFVRIVVRRPWQAARTHKPAKVGATTAGWVVPGFLASKCIDTLVIAGSAVDVFKDNLCVGTRSCWYWVCGYECSGEEGDEGIQSELHLQFVGVFFKFERNEDTEFSGVLGVSCTVV